VRGIGEKTALALLKEYRTVEKIYEALEKSPPKFKEKFSAVIYEKLFLGKSDAELSKKLATIRTNVPLEFALGRAKTHDFDEEKLRRFLEKYRFISLVKRMPKSKRAENSQQQLF